MSVANAAEIASVRYVHELLEHNYGVYVPVNDTLTKLSSNAMIIGEGIFILKKKSIKVIGLRYM